MTFGRFISLLLVLPALTAIGLFVIVKLSGVDCEAPPPAGTPATSEVPATPSEQPLVNEVRRDVARLRQLAFKSPVPVREWTREETERYILDKLESDWSEERMAADERAFKMLGLLPPDYRLREEILALLREQVAGLYDPKSRTMILVRTELVKGFEKLFLSHELTHALEDQYFDLGRRIEEGPDTLDHDFCTSSVIEGGATIIMMQYLQEQMVKDPELIGAALKMDWLTASERLLSAPPLMQHLLLGSYFRGMSFIGHFRRDGWSRVDEIFSDFPLTSEQVMHPEKYYPRRDFPKRIDLVDVRRHVGRGRRDGGWRPGSDTTLGEAGVQAMVETWAQLLEDDALKESVETVAAGWDGDRLVSFEHATGDAVVFWISTWDTPKDAEEMHEALEKWVTNWCEDGTDKNAHRQAQLVRPWRQGEDGVDVICLLTVSRRAAATTATIPVYRKVNVSSTADLKPRDVTP